MDRVSRKPAPPLVLTAALLVAPVVAQADEDWTLSVELNRVDQVEDACRFTFLAENGLGVDVASFTVETVIIDTGGTVDRLTLFEFGALPDGIPRVRQFDVPDLSCMAVRDILINGVAECGGVENCAAAVELSSRTDVELLG
jgi:hypothetical protein